MSSQTWLRTRKLFAAALELAPADRPAFLASCPDDPDLLAEVASLLAHHREEDEFLGPPAPKSVVELPPGTRIGPYEIVRLVGHGGMGVVYEALRVDDYRQAVALKLIRRTGSDEEQVRRFYAERQILARLQHPNISRLLDGGVTADGTPYLVMEFISGLPLDQYCEQQALPLADRARLVLTVCAAVEHAHRADVVHRDLKPGNILVAPDGIPRVTDFGLAKHVGMAPLAADGTVTGAILGTPEYMAPEQANGRGREAGLSADVYALGAILYCLLAGRPPFRADSPIDTLHQVLNTEPAPPRRMRPEVPRDLETICLKCLEKQARRRYRSAAELAEDLRRYLDHEPIRARPISLAGRLVRWGRRNPGWAATGALVCFGLVALLSLTAAFVVRLEREGNKTRMALDESRRRSAQLALDRAIGLCEQGYIGRGTLMMAATLRTVDQSDVDLQRLLRLNLAGWVSRLNPIRGFADAGDDVQVLAYGLKGRRLITGAADGRAQVWDAVTGGPIGPSLNHGVDLSAVALSPDGHTAATGARDGTLALWNVESGQLIRREQCDVKPLRKLTFSPDGLVGLAGGGTPFGTEGKAWLWDGRMGAPRGSTLAHSRPVRAAAFSADGRFFVTCGECSTVWVWDAKQGRSLPERLEVGRPVWLFEIAVSLDGRFIAACSRDKEVWIWDRANDPPRLQILPHTGFVWCLAFGSDGLSLATGCDWGGGEGALHRWRWRKTAKSGDWEPDGPPTHHQGLVHALAVRADGSLAAASRSPNVRLWEILTAPLPTTFVHDSAVNAVAFHPNAGLLATGCGRPKPEWGQARLWRLDTGKPRGDPISHAGSVTQVAFSPDGKLLLTNALDKQTCLWRVEDLTSAAPPLRDTEFVESVAWSRDGRRILLGKENGDAVFWDPVTRQVLGALPRHREPVYAAAISQDGTTAVTGDMVGWTRLWRIADGASRGTLPRQHAAVQAVTISADGRWLATAGRDRTAQVWDAATLQPTSRVLFHPQAVWTVAFSPDGSLVATGCGDMGGDRGEWRLWDVKSGVPLGPPQPSRGRVAHLAFSPDGSQVAIGSEGGEARLYPVPKMLAGPVEDILLWIEMATGMEILLDKDSLPSDEIVRTLSREEWQARRRQLHLAPRGGHSGIPVW
jgi:WD40 repeat protein